MAQMPIQLLSGRAEPFTAASVSVPAARPRTAIPTSAYLIDKSGISGGLLRPGAMDQALFKASLAEAQRQAVAGPAVSAAPTAGPLVPTLSPAQLAALGLDVGAPAAPAEDELVIDIPGPNPVDPGEGSGQAGAGAPAAPSGSTVPPASATGAAPATDAPAATDAVPRAAPSPTTTPTAAPQPTTPAPQANAALSGPIPRARMGADGVWELPRMPDKDEREMLYGQKWRVVQNEESRKLFLGPDGEFGWDDFADLVNPLQHIPLVNIAYRAITGDEIYGAARLADFAFGPLAGVSTALDLAFRSMTGKSMAENGIAMLFGDDEGAPADAAPADAAPANAAIVNTASGNQQLAAAMPIRRGSIR